MITSDGFHEQVTRVEMAETLAKEQDVSRLSATLVNTAVRNNRKVDDITVVAVKVDEVLAPVTRPEHLGERTEAETRQATPGELFTKISKLGKIKNTSDQILYADDLRDIATGTLFNGENLNRMPRTENLRNMLAQLLY